MYIYDKNLSYIMPNRVDTFSDSIPYFSIILHRSFLKNPINTFYLSLINIFKFLLKVNMI